jgi:hypothetical protein
MDHHRLQVGITCLYPDFRHQEHGAIRLAIAPAGLWIRRPPGFAGNLFPSRPSKVGGEESADATGPVTCGTYDPTAPPGPWRHQMSLNSHYRSRPSLLLRERAGRPAMGRKSKPAGRKARIRPHRVPFQGERNSTSLSCPRRCLAREPRRPPLPDKR